MVAIQLVFFFFIQPIASGEDNNLKLSSESVILIDSKTSKVLYEKNAERRMYPASITKIVTANIAIEEGNLSDIVKVSENAASVHGTSVYLLEDEEIELKRLIQGLLINSGNDAGVAIAEHLAGSEQGFTEHMNDYLKNEIGVYDTNFTNPHGLFNEMHYTTAKDMAKITQYALDNETFKEIVGTEKLDWVGEGWETTLYNHHQLLRDLEEVTGVKNGFVPQSGFTLVTSAKKEDLELIAVTLNAPTSQNLYDDTKVLLDYGFNNFSTLSIDSGESFRDKLNNLYETHSSILLTFNKHKALNLVVEEDSLVIKENDEILLKQPLNKVTSNQEETMSTEEINTNDIEPQAEKLSLIQRFIEMFKSLF